MKLTKEQTIKLILSNTVIKEDKLTYVKCRGKYIKRKSHYLNGKIINRDEYKAIQSLLKKYKLKVSFSPSMDWDKLVN